MIDIVILLTDTQHHFVDAPKFEDVDKFLDEQGFWSQVSPDGKKMYYYSDGCALELIVDDTGFEYQQSVNGLISTYARKTGMEETAVYTAITGTVIYGAYQYLSLKMKSLLNAIVLASQDAPSEQMLKLIEHVNEVLDGE